jgi:MFS family permease
MRLPRTVIALSLVSLFTDISSEMIYPLIPVFLSTVLGAGALTVGTIEGAAETVAALLKLASGWWSDRLARRKPLVVAGYLLASVARPLVAFAQGATQVFGIRVVDRVGKGIRTAPRDALIADAVDPDMRGRAFGFHRAADHLGAVVGPLLAFALLGLGLGMRRVFLLASIPAALAVVILVFGVHESRRPRADAVASGPRSSLAPGKLRARFWLYLSILFLFTLGNSTDAYLLLRAANLGVPVAMAPLLWAMLHVVKSASSTPGGILSDKLGRRPLIIAGWLLYAAVYFAFGAATRPWHAWGLFAVYGIYFGLTEGVEKALIADIVPADRRGAAFGWYNLAIAIGALPASLLFGFLWESRGPSTAFAVGAGLSLAAAVAMAVFPGGASRATVSGAR